MPNRILKEGFKHSERIHSLSWLERCAYIGILLTVDDYGRFDGREIILRAQVFPLDMDKVGHNEFVKVLENLAKAGLIRRYDVDGKPYIQVENWQNVPRAKCSKYPACIADAMQMQRTCAADAAHMHSRRIAHAPVTETGTVTECINNDAAEAFAEAERKGEIAPLPDVVPRAIPPPTVSTGPPPIEPYREPVRFSGSPPFDPRIVDAVAAFFGVNTVNVNRVRLNDAMNTAEATSVERVVAVLAEGKAEGLEFWAALGRAKADSSKAGWRRNGTQGNNGGKRGAGSETGGGRVRKSAADRGEYPEDDSPLPTV